jgi:methylated-DNA-protein-cysteine methyltransferase related protein
VTDASAREQAQAAAIYAVVRAIPRGKVATYGQVALLAGIPRGHRIAARAMQRCPAKLPWQRVLAKKDARRAKISISDPEHAAEQRALLAADGVQFDRDGFIELRSWGWLPIDLPGRRARS